MGDGSAKGKGGGDWEQSVEGSKLTDTSLLGHQFHFPPNKVLNREGWKSSLKEAATGGSDGVGPMSSEVGDPKRWRFTGLYGKPKVEERYRMWNLLRQLSLQGNFPWVVGGDYNEIISNSDKFGGAVRSASQMKGMQDALDFCDLGDIKFLGPKFTWMGIRGGEEVKIRLDRFTCNDSWKDLYPASCVSHLLPSTSDHLPILLPVREKKKRRKKRRKRFKFEEFWLQDEKCREVVKKGWESITGVEPFSTVCKKINATRRALEDWSEEHFGSLKKEIENTRAKLAVLYDNSCSAPLDVSRVELESKLHALLQKEQAFWKQRAKIFWLSNGDLNTKFFHQRAKNRYKKNSIEGLFNSEGKWCTDDRELEQVVVSYFMELFMPLQPTCFQNILEAIPCVINEEENQRLTRGIEQEEDLVGNDVVEAVRSMVRSDDCLRAEVPDCLAIKNILMEYETVSGQQVNFQKSCISFSKNVSLVFQEELAGILGMTRVEKHDKYLGLSIEISYSKEEAFEFVNEKIRVQTQGWREKTLSGAGKEVLIKAMAQAIPSYVMGCFELPKHLCNTMEQLMARYWWGGSEEDRKIHWLSWEKLCHPKSEGRL
ncbi:uncharacterized protein LOC133716149 [Rosa rugosa]|uniref:uncharacterized protein LOC133716149 n=1 Tax=Rosa rugosa TaxID=74645 RepID=UPI002B417D0F|nr:uncharacterized protein LOC133716149 [Rosa rugosa]